MTVFLALAAFSVPALAEDRLVSFSIALVGFSPLEGQAVSLHEDMEQALLEYFKKSPIEWRVVPENEWRKIVAGGVVDAVWRAGPIGQSLGADFVFFGTLRLIRGEEYLLELNLVDVEHPVWTLRRTKRGTPEELHGWVKTNVVELFESLAQAEERRNRLSRESDEVGDSFSNTKGKFLRVGGGLHRLNLGTFNGQFAELEAAVDTAYGSNVYDIGVFGGEVPSLRLDAGIEFTDGMAFMFGAGWEGGQEKAATWFDGVKGRLPVSLLSVEACAMWWIPGFQEFPMKPYMSIGGGVWRVSFKYEDSRLTWTDVTTGATFTSPEFEGFGLGLRAAAGVSLNVFPGFSLDVEGGYLLVNIGELRYTTATTLTGSPNFTNLVLVKNDLNTRWQMDLDGWFARAAVRFAAF